MKMRNGKRNGAELHEVNLVRKDYVLEDKVIIATLRAKRPSDFHELGDVKSPAESCPFCTHNQEKVVIADEIPAPGTPEGWSFRSVVNIFSAVSDKNRPPLITGRRQSFTDEQEAYGYAEVLIENPDHTVELEDLPVETIAGLLRFMTRRVKELRSRNGIRYVTLFKNRGRLAGASISHSHTQIIATHFVPPRIADILEASYSYTARYGNCPYCEVLSLERKSQRFIAEDDCTIAFSPFASEFPFEFWIFPRRHVPCMGHFTDQEYESCARMLRRALLSLESMGRPPYNLVFVMDHFYGDLHMHLKLLPRLATWAGFEFATGTTINPVPPEDAARFYRDGFAKNSG